MAVSAVKIGTNTDHEHEQEATDARNKAYVFSASCQRPAKLFAVLEAVKPREVFRIGFAGLDF